MAGPIHVSPTHTPPCTTHHRQHRLDKIRALRWETGPVLPPALQARLSAKEAEYFSSYDKLLSQYMQQYPGLDLPGAAQVGGGVCWS